MSMRSPSPAASWPSASGGRRAARPSGRRPPRGPPDGSGQARQRAVRLSSWGTPSLRDHRRIPHLHLNQITRTEDGNMAPRRSSIEINPLFSRPGEATQRPRYALADDPMLPETAYQVVHDEAMLDGNARLNLATFVGTWMDPAAAQLYSESFAKNMIDKDEYHATAEIEDRCWKILARLWHAPEPHAAIGTSTIGSSEACMLGGLALKRRWQLARRAPGKPAERPNLVMSSAGQVCWE